MATLTELLKLFLEHSDICISITDTSGILSKDPFRLPLHYYIHSQPFCSITKTVDKGFEQCMRCKNFCNKKAVMKKQSFEGLCSFGIHEIVYPVIHEGTTLCIIYIGNFLIDRTQSIEKLKKTVKKTGTDYHALLSEMNKMPVVDSSKKYWSMAEFIADYILYNLSNIKYTNTEHWLVKLMKDNIRSNYEQSLTLKMFAKMYYMNEKYLGRIFKKQTGMSFHQYLLNTRLRHAASMLEHTNDTIISISIKCGFASSSYFDSSFVKKYNMTPKVYQKKFRSAES